MKIQFFQFWQRKTLNIKLTFVSWKWGLFQRQRLPKSFSQLYVKNSRFFLSYFLVKDDWHKAYAGPRLPTLPYLWVHDSKDRDQGIYREQKTCFGRGKSFNDDVYHATKVGVHKTTWYHCTRRNFSFFETSEISTQYSSASKSKSIFEVRSYYWMRWIHNS